MKNSKIEQRIRRSKKTRMSIRRLNAVRLTVYRSAQHIYAQVIAPGVFDVVVASASTVEKTFRDVHPSTGNIEAAKAVGKAVARRALDKGVLKVAFDRSGYQYHGRVKALAEAAREEGLVF
jgi:large subunit ribosomal protein L18